MIIEKTPGQLAKEDLIRQTLEAAADRIERGNGNSTYKRAWEIAAKWVRDLATDLTRNA